MPFSIRSLADAGTTLEALRQAVMQAPAGTNLILLQDGTVHFPAVCPNCGQPAAATLRIERGFLFHVQSGDDTPNDSAQSVDEYDVPFCDACLERQRSEQVPLSAWTPVRRILSEAEGLAGVAVMGIALMFFTAAVQTLSLFPLVLGCFPFGIGFWLARSTWNKSRHMSVPKPTGVDLAVDFTPLIALAFEPAWRAFHFRSQRYAELFRQANLVGLWNPRSVEAQSAAAKRNKDSFRMNLIVGTVVAAVLLWSLWSEVLSPYVLPYFRP